MCYGDEATDFLNEEMAKVDSNYTCLAVIEIDFILKKNENYYPQIFLIECKYIEKKKWLLDILLMTLKIILKILMNLMKKKLKGAFCKKR